MEAKNRETEKNLVAVLCKLGERVGGAASLKTVLAILCTAVQ